MDLLKILFDTFCATSTIELVVIPLLMRPKCLKQTALKYMTSEGIVETRKQQPNLLYVF